MNNKNDVARDQIFKNLIFQSTIFLRKIGEDNLPIDAGSACVIKYKNKRILISAAHVTEKTGRWMAELRYDKKTKLKMHVLGDMNYYTEFSNMNPGGKRIDFSYVEIPDSFNAFRQNIDVDGNILNEVQIIDFITALDVNPCANTRYGFCGSVLPVTEIHPDRVLHESTIQFQDNLKFLRVENECLVFELPEKHACHKFFKGCSGAPVVSYDAELVGIVCKGEEETNEIFAFSLVNCKRVLDAYIDRKHKKWT